MIYPHFFSSTSATDSSQLWETDLFIHHWCSDAVWCIGQLRRISKQCLRRVEFDFAWPLLSNNFNHFMVAWQSSPEGVPCVSVVTSCWLEHLNSLALSTIEGSWTQELSVFWRSPGDSEHPRGLGTCSTLARLDSFESTYDYVQKDFEEPYI